MKDGTFANTLLVGRKIVPFWGNAVLTPDLVSLVRLVRTFLQAQIASRGLFALLRTFLEYVTRREVIRRRHILAGPGRAATYAEGKMLK